MILGRPSFAALVGGGHVDTGERYVTYCASVGGLVHAAHLVRRKTPIGDSMNRNRVHHVVLASTVVLILFGCSLPRRPEPSTSTLVPMAIAPRADLTPSGLGNAYDGQPELLASCAKWQGRGVYAGCARRIAKVSLVPETEAPTELYTSVADFKRNALDADHMLDLFMRDGIEPRLRTGANSDRHPSERRNVAIDVLLYAVKHEPDNDYHLIVGDPDCQKSECFFNIEVSGLPLASHPDFDALKAAQSGFEAFIAHASVGGSYHYWNEPPRARVSGSLFYDISHPPGDVGPKGMRPWTAWEIHPVRTIEIWEE